MHKIRLFFCFTIFLLAACARDGPEPDAVVDPMGARFGALPVFATLGAALRAAPEETERPYRILVRPGDYYEQLVIDKPNIQLRGEGADQVRIYHHAYAGQETNEGDTLGTRRTATLKVLAPGVQLHNLTVENSFDYVANDKLDSDDPDKLLGSQAVALHLDGDSDRFLARDVKLLGHQDTLFVNAGRSMFERSLIAGSVDFIFGAGNALFTDSQIRTRARGGEHEVHGYIAAPSTDIESEFGLTFINCRLTREEGVPDGSTALGRPWHPTRTFSDGRYADPDAVGKAVYIDTYMDAHILDKGWASMGGTARDGNGKDWFHPEDSRFYEYNSRGPGAHQHKKRPQLTDKEASRYTVNNILNGWVPE